jgi:hypothetical protein
MLAHWVVSLTTIGKNIQIGSLAGLGLLLFMLGTALRKRLPLHSDQPRSYPARTLDLERPKPSVGAFVAAGKMIAKGTHLNANDPGLRAVQSRSSYPLA